MDRQQIYRVARLGPRIRKSRQRFVALTNVGDSVCMSSLREALSARFSILR